MSTTESVLPIDLKLDTSDELVITDNDLVFTTGIAATAQQCSLALRSFKGEWFGDLNSGVPWYQDILGEKYNEPKIRGVMRDALLAVDTVASIQKLELSFNGQSRNVNVNWTVLSNAGEIVEGSTNI